MAAPVTALARIGEAYRALSAAKTLDDVMEIRNKAEAIRAYAKAASDSGDTASMATEIKLLAEMKAGEMLAESTGGRGGDRKSSDTMSLDSLDDLGIDKKQSSRWQQMAKVSEEDFSAYVADCRESGRELTQAGLLNIARGCHVTHNSGENEWYTPPDYIEAARMVMGGIDLDPASCELAQTNVRAGRFYTADDNGLDKKWIGNVWLNPPYSKDLIGPFAAKVVEESQRFDQAVILVNNATDTAWFHQIASVASAVCFLRGRVKFLDKTGKPANTPVQGQAVIYIGGNVARFAEVFSSFGFVAFVAHEVSNA
jgi:phage N-6-adenine-methyltransferase